MRFTKILLAAALVLSPIAANAMGSYAFAQSAPAVVQPPVAGPPPVVSAPVADPKAGTFITVKDGAAVVSGGSVIGEALMWLALVFGSVFAGALMKYVIIPFEKKIGVEVSEKNNARLQDTIENAIALSAQRAQVSLKDKLDINVRSGVAVNALEYVQAHGVETLKAMGVPDPTDPKAMEALQARIAKAMDAKLAGPTITVAEVIPPTVAGEPGKV